MAKSKIKRKKRTFAILDEKAAIARETFQIAGITEQVNFIRGDFLKVRSDIKKIAFCFFNCEKHLYGSCFDIVSEKMISGGPNWGDSGRSP